MVLAWPAIAYKSSYWYAVEHSQEGVDYIGAQKYPSRGERGPHSIEHSSAWFRTKKRDWLPGPSSVDHRTVTLITSFADRRSIASQRVFVNGVLAAQRDATPWFDDQSVANLLKSPEPAP